MRREWGVGRVGGGGRLFLGLLLAGMAAVAAAASEFWAWTGRACINASERVTRDD